MATRTPPPTVLPDPCPELLVERGPHGRGVGSWVPQDKHRLLASYLDATRFAWKKWPERYFIDPFCGPGRVQVEGETFTREGGAVVAWRALAQDAPFTGMLVGDLEAERAHACEQRLAAAGAPVRSFVGPAIQTVPRMVQAVPRNALCFAYIDPYNLEFLSFSLLKTLSQLNVDLAINFCTMDLQRNAEFEFEPQRARFDETAPGWRLDPGVLAASKRNVPVAFFAYWCRLVQELGFSNSREMPFVRNDHGHPIYRLVFFARHSLPTRIWGDVARDANRSLF